MLLMRQRHDRGGVELNMAAMIDVVFLLLVFFMCTTSFDEVENDLTANLPELGGASLEDDFEPIRVRLCAGEVDGGGSANVVIWCDNDRCDTFAMLGEALRDRRAIADVAVIIEAEDSVAFECMVNALDESYAAGFERVAFSPRGAGIEEL